MKIAIIGYGKMGGQIEETARKTGHTVVAVIDPFCAGQRAQCGVFIDKSIESSKLLADAEVALEFTKPDIALENIRLLAERNIPIITGTTGWYDKLAEVKVFIEGKNASLLYSANFSLGVNLFYRIAAYAARLIDAFPEYDVGGYEIHHNKKADSPSGTAKTLVERVIAASERKTRPVWDKLDRQLTPEELHFASLRAGSDFGTHVLIFDSLADSIEITHRARNRSGFASGAILAAQWLISVKRGGVFTIDDVLEDI